MIAGQIWTFKVRPWSQIEPDTLDMGLSDVWVGSCVREYVGKSVVESCEGMYRGSAHVMHEGWNIR